MNTVQAQTQAANVEKLALSNSKSKKDKSASDGTDFFAQFLQSITGQSNVSGNGSLLEMLGGKKADGEDEMSSEASMEMLAALLNGSYSFLGGLQNNAGQALSGMSAEGMQLLNGLSGTGSDNTDAGILQKMMMLQGLQASANDLNAGNANSAQAQNALLQELMQDGQAGQGGQADPFGSQAGGDIMSQSNLPTGTQAAAQALTSAFAAASRTASPADAAMQAQQNAARSAAAGNVSEVDGVPIVSAGAQAQSANAETSSEQLFKGSMEFQNSIVQAQRLMKHHNQSDTADSSAEAELQAISQSQSMSEMTNAKSITTGQAQQSSGSMVDMEHLGEQIKGGIARGDVTGDREFSVKLRPEGLGEVTIKLIKEANQITVSIVAASESTARLLNDQLPTLKQNMQGFDVPTNIRDVEVANQQQGFASMQQQMSMNQSDRQGQYSQNNNGGNGSGSGYDGTEQDTQERSVLENSGISLYA